MLHSFITNVSWNTWGLGGKTSLEFQVYFDCAYIVNDVMWAYKIFLV